MTIKVLGLIGILVVGLFFLLLGGALVLSDRFFTYWQNTHWKEPDNSQWTPKTVDYSRYGTALGSAAVGAAIVIMVVYSFFKL